MIVDVADGAARLRSGDVVAYPTETVYGLGADAASAPALDRLRSIKGRERDRGLSVLVEDAQVLAALAPGLPEEAAALARRFWPGPLTLVVPVGGDGTRLCDEVFTERGVGFRCSSWPTAAALAVAFGRPLVSTSCNRSGERPCRDGNEVSNVFGPDLAVVGGEPSGGLEPSTVVAVGRGGALDLIREGAIPFRRICEEIAA
jgi:L-threonylcarbamoyladenylate synthase